MYKKRNISKTPFCGITQSSLITEYLLDQTFLVDFDIVSVNDQGGRLGEH